VLIGSMTLTPGAGNYIAFFTASGGVNNTARTLFFSIYVGGSQIAASEVRMLGDTSTKPVAITTPVAPTAGQAVEVRWRLSSATGAPTGTCFQRTLTLLPLKVSV
jgi:hypothetical protein